MTEHCGSQGIQANYAWCATRGAGSCLFLIDAPLNYLHPDIQPQLLGDVTPQPLPQSGTWAYHGMECAALAVASINCQGMVGVAPEAFLYPYEFRLGDPAFDPYLKLRDYLDDIWYRAYSGYDVVNMSWAFVNPLTPQQQSQIESRLQWLYDDGIPLFAARGESTDYPASSPWVCAVQGVKRYPSQGLCGATAAVRAPCSDFAVLPTWYDPWWRVPPSDYFGSSYACAITAGAAILILRCGLWSPASLYQELADETTIYGRVIPSMPCGLTGINDIADFEVSSAPGCRVQVDYDILDVEGIGAIRIFASPSCWGPFELCHEFYPSEDGHYQHLIDRLCSGTQYIQMRVYGGGGYAFYQGSALAGTGCGTCAQPELPEFFDASAHAATVELRWSTVDEPSSWQYYIVGGAAADLETCGWGGRWGSWGRALLPLYGQGCDCCIDEPEECQCWEDDGLAPGAYFSYRLAVVERSAQGRFMGMSAFTPEATVYINPASAPDEPIAAGSGARLWPVPWSRTDDLRMEFATESAGKARVAFYDASGRIVCSDGVAIDVSSGRNEVRLPAAMIRSALRASGVYFAAISLPDGQRVARRLVVVP